MRALFNLISAILTRFRRAHELRKYDRFTIAEYFRKQGVIIGEGCSIIPRTIGTEPYLVKIGNNVTIAKGVNFMTHDGAVWLFRDEMPDLQVFGPIIIGNNCVVGANAILFPNIKIGDNSIIGAGSVVISDVPANTIVMGVPARPFGSIEKYKEKCIEKWKIQRPPNIQIEEGKTWWNSSHFHENREKLKGHLLEVYKEDLN